MTKKFIITSVYGCYKETSSKVVGYLTTLSAEVFIYQIMLKSNYSEGNASAEGKAPSTPFFVVSEGTANLLQAYITTSNQLAKTMGFVAAFWGANQISGGGGTMEQAVLKLKQANEALLAALQNCVWENICFEMAGAEGAAGEKITI